jgi:SAM-dependent methyltransferase
MPVPPRVRSVIRRIVPAPIRSTLRRAARRPAATTTDAGAEASIGRLLRPFVPRDHARQVDARYYLDLLMSEDPKPRVVMDLGCGRGDSVDLFRAHDPDVDWVGVDIPASPEVLARQRSDARFVSYDGATLPFEDGMFDLIYSRQVLEHVRHPVVHLAEVRRALRPGGAFIGSTSQLEPYHSRSLWNYTAFGFAELVAEAGLRLVEIRPGIDGVTLVLRSYLERPDSFGRWWREESPLNALIDDEARESGRNAARVNLRKLQFAGQFAFLVRRPES